MDHTILATSVSAWLWQNYGKSITGKALGAMRAKWDKFNWNKASESYRNRVRQIYGTTHILGVSEPVSLEGIYTDVFILDKPTAFLRYDMQRLLAKSRQWDHWDHSQRKAKAAKKLKKGTVKKGSDKSKQSDQGNLDPDVIRRDALTVVSERRKLFILGKPGAGKTTLLKYLTLQSAGERLNRIPIFISLKEYTDSRTELIPFIVRQFEICDFPDAQLFILQLLNEGKAIVLFDGLDEVNQEKDERGMLVNTLKKFFYQYPDNQYLVTCRIAATDYSFEDFTYVEIADFDNNQIQIFVAKWFKSNHQKCDKFLEDLNNDDNKGLRELASIPLLLILLCLAFDETMTFPLRRVEIYEEAIEALLKKWDASRNIKRDVVYRKLSLGRKRQMLARIAAETFESGAYFVPQQLLEKLISNYLNSLPPADGSEDIDGESILKTIEAQHGLLVGRAWRIYSFSHLTFQEYFAAKYIADNEAAGTLHGLMRRVTDSRWREVFLLTASLLDNADNFFELFLKAKNQFVVEHASLTSFLSWRGKWEHSFDAATDYPARAKAFDREINYVFEAIPTQLSPYVQDVGYARSCALELALNAGIFPPLLLAIVFDLNLALEFAAGGLESVFLPANSTMTKGCSAALAHAITLGKHLNISAVIESLSKLKTPSENDSWDAWHGFAEGLQQSMPESLEQLVNIGEDGLKSISQYLESSILLVECLSLACVTDRNGIVARMF